MSRVSHSPLGHNNVYYRYLEAGKKKQGTYECSKRPVTIWENPRTVLDKFQGYVHDHPNFHSLYQNELMGWPDVHVRIPPRVSAQHPHWCCVHVTHNTRARAERSHERRLAPRRMVGAHR